MRIEEDLKLGFKDVLIRPKRSTLKSRSDVELERQFTFKHSGQSWSGVPIIAAKYGHRRHIFYGLCAGFF
ncbi:GMP reductase [Escherichia coli]|uniref:GMP reductase n=1 Tax=Escherichia coli TaxID=562 RepID=A0A377DXA7_ECOLX|nr:GMP reductase [Escherichia coli]